VISLAALADLYQQHRSEGGTPVGPLLVGDRTYDVDDRPLVLGTINLSRDSTYRESVAVSTDSAIRRGRVLAAQGADVVDIGAESSTAKARRVGADEQIELLTPVVSALAKDDVQVSVETYFPEVADACLSLGASMVNYTGHDTQEEMFDLVARHTATLLLCRVTGGNVREVGDVPLDQDPVPDLLEHFGSRVELARRHGVERIVLDPAMGFYYANLTDPEVRVAHQTRVLLNTFRLSSLGLPVCHAVPHAFDLFEDEFRIAESFFAVLAYLGGTTVVRTHEVPRVAAVLNAMRTLTL
jgi:dihydropteroate synthase